MFGYSFINKNQKDPETTEDISKGIVSPTYEVDKRKFVMSQKTVGRTVQPLKSGRIVYEFEKSMAHEDFHNFYIHIKNETKELDCIYCGLFERKDIPDLILKFEAFLQSEDRFFDFVKVGLEFKKEFPYRGING